MAVKIGHASISERGTIRGNAGDQTGKEVFIRNWYRNSKGWVLLRCTVDGMADYIAEAAEKGCANDDIGYDQIENQTLWDNVKDKGWDPSKTTKKVETDCARFVRVCVQYAIAKMGIDKVIGDFYTATEASVLTKSGMFKKYTASKYVDQDDYLQRGDILVTKTKGHTLMILTNGSKVKSIDVPASSVTVQGKEDEKDYKLGERIMREGDEGADVKEMQGLLIQLGYDLGSWGADGEFGEATEIAVKKFQEEHNCEVDGEVGEETLKAIDKAFEGSDGVVKGANRVEIRGGNCYVRSAPNKNTGKALGIARKGTILPYGGETSDDGWLLVEYKNKNGWVSGKYGHLIKEG